MDRIQPPFQKENMSKSKKGDLSSKLADLSKAIEASSEKIVQGPALSTHDLSIPYSHMLSAAAKCGMANKVKDLFPKRKLQFLSTTQEEVIDVVQFFSAIAVGPEKIAKAARIITDLINGFAAKGYVTGCLAPLSYIKLINEPHTLERYAVYCFVAMTEEGDKAVKESKSPYAVQEGMIGPTVT